MERFIEQILTGLAYGSLIAIIALGYTIVYGILELINFAHGDVFMTGGMMSLTLITLFGVSSMPLLARVGMMLVVVLIAMLWCATLNATIERLAYRPLRKAPRLVPLISAIGMSFIVMNCGGFWGVALKGGSSGWGKLNVLELLPQVLDGGKYRQINILTDWLHLNTSIMFSLKELVVILIAIPIMVGLHLFVQRTRLGKAMRATAQSFDAAALMGIDVNRTIAAAFMIGGALGGAAGFIYSMYQNEVFFQLGFFQGLNAFTAAVLGGIGNIGGAVLGGLVIGIVYTLTSFYVSSDMAPVAVFATLILIIIFRPSGLLGENVPEKV